MDLITVLIALAISTSVSFLLHLVGQTNWRRSTKAIFYAVSGLTLAAAGTYFWFAFPQLTITTAIYLVAQLLCQVICDCIDRWSRRRLAERLLQDLEEAMRKSHENGTIGDHT